MRPVRDGYGKMNSQIKHTRKRNHQTDGTVENNNIQVSCKDRLKYEQYFEKLRVNVTNFCIVGDFYVFCVIVDVSSETILAF